MNKSYIIPDQLKEKLLLKAAMNRVPATGIFELSPLCNLECKMCYIRQDKTYVKNNGGLISADKWLELAKSAVEKGLLFLLLTGGEPFIYPEFDCLYESLNSLGLMISINTNATAISERQMQMLTKHAPLKLNLTLYGASNESYRRLCKDGSAFDRAIATLDELLARKIKIRLNTSLTEQNKDELPAICELAKSRGLILNTATYMFPPLRRGMTNFKDGIRLSPEDAGKYLALSNRMQLSDDDFLRITENKKMFRDVNGDECISISNDGCTEGGKMRCRAGKCTFWIDWQGYMSACGMVDTCKTNVFDVGFDTAWKNAVEFADNARYSPECVTCENRSYCYTCIAMAYCENGRFDKRPEYICRMLHASAREHERLALMIHKPSDGNAENGGCNNET